MTVHYKIQQYISLLAINSSFNTSSPKRFKANSSKLIHYIYLTPDTVTYINKHLNIRHRLTNPPSPPTITLSHGRLISFLCVCFRTTTWATTRPRTRRGPDRRWRRSRRLTRERTCRCSQCHHRPAWARAPPSTRATCPTTRCRKNKTAVVTILRLFPKKKHLKRKYLMQLTNGKTNGHH